MEVCLICLFFLVRDALDRVACAPYTIVMIIATAFIAIFQYMLGEAFGPLLTYLPITLEDNAAVRDQEFANEQDAARKKHLFGRQERGGEDLNNLLDARERAKNDGTEMRTMDTPRVHPETAGAGDWKPTGGGDMPNVELFLNIADEIEDLTPEERDQLVARAFQHPAIRAKRPVIWIPRDDLGVSDDEIIRTMKLSDKVWISNEYAGLDSRGRIQYSRSPPDFDMRDLVEL